MRLWTACRQALLITDLCIYVAKVGRILGFLGGSVVKNPPTEKKKKKKNPPTKQETQALSLGQGNPLEKEMATHSSILAWRTPWTEEPGGMQSTGSQELEKEVLDNLKIYYKEEFFSYRIQGFTLHSEAKF